MKLRYALTSLILLIFLLLGGSTRDIEELTSLFSVPSPTIHPSRTLGISDEQTYLVTKVIDGDTIELEGGQKVRYIGIDTPELKGDECYAKQARDKNKELVEGKRVKLQKDISETDKYGRFLRFVYNENGDFINNILVQEGYATVATYPPDVSYQELFQKSQQEAISQNRGLWNANCR